MKIRMSSTEPPARRALSVSLRKPGDADSPEDRRSSWSRAAPARSIPHVVHREPYLALRCPARMWPSHPSWLCKTAGRTIVAHQALDGRVHVKTIAERGPAPYPAPRHGYPLRPQRRRARRLRHLRPPPHARGGARRPHPRALRGHHQLRRRHLRGPRAPSSRRAARWTSSTSRPAAPTSAASRCSPSPQERARAGTTRAKERAAARHRGRRRRPGRAELQAAAAR